MAPPFTVQNLNLEQKMGSRFLFTRFTQVFSFRNLIEKDKKVKDIFKDSQAKIDRLADKGVIHKNKAARLKSRLNSKLKS